MNALTLILTAQCNLRCAYCYQDGKRPRRMGWPVAEAALRLLMESDSPVLDLHFLGGEPLLEFPLLRRTVGFVSRRMPAGRSCRFHLTSNGTLLDEKALAFLEAHEVSTRISFDGAAAAQESRAPGTFPILDRLFGQLRSRHPEFLRRRVSFCITVTPATVPLLPASVDYFLDRGGPDLLIAPAIRCDDAWRAEGISGLEEAFGRVFESSLEYWKQSGDVPLALFRDRREGEELGRTGRSGCSLPRGDWLTVDADGRGYGCPLLAGSYRRGAGSGLQRRWRELELGDIRAPGFAARWKGLPGAVRRSGLIDNLERRHSVHGRCGDCPHAALCALCPAASAFVPGNEDPDRESSFNCAFQRVALAERRRFPLNDRLQRLLAGPPGLAEAVARMQLLAESVKAKER